VRIRAENTEPAKKKTQALCYFVAEKSDTPFGFSKIDQKLSSTVKQVCKETKGKLGSISIVHTHGMIPSQRIVIAGLGPKDKITHETIRLVSGKIAKKSSDLGLDEFCVVSNNLPPSSKIAANAIVEGTKLSLYSFDKYKKEKKSKQPNLTILVSDSAKISDSISRAQAVSEGVIYTRSIANLPPNECNPAQLAGFAKLLATKNKVKCTVLSKSELKKKGFGGISAVGQGSKNEPKLIIFEYNGKRGEKPTVLVGKAVTFDTGGISIKPADKMDEMKFDKCGGCTVFGIIKAASELRLPVNQIGRAHV